MTDPSMREHITLNRNLSLRDATLIGIGAMIGAGIYVLTGFAARVSLWGHGKNKPSHRRRSLAVRFTPRLMSLSRLSHTAARQKAYHDEWKFPSMGHSHSL